MLIQLFLPKVVQSCLGKATLQLYSTWEYHFQNII